MPQNIDTLRFTIYNEFKNLYLSIRHIFCQTHKKRRKQWHIDHNTVANCFFKEYSIPFVTSFNFFLFSPHFSKINDTICCCKLYNISKWIFVIHIPLYRYVSLSCLNGRMKMTGNRKPISNMISTFRYLIHHML